MIARRLAQVTGLALALIAGGLFFAQQQKLVPPQPGGRPQRLAPPTVLGLPPGAGTAEVAGGPEPWYTVFGTGDVVGFIEPCG